MSFGRTVSRCHVCRSEWVTGCVQRNVCVECKKLGHSDSMDCPKCDREYLAGVVDGLLEELTDLRSFIKGVGIKAQGRDGDWKLVWDSVQELVKHYPQIDKDPIRLIRSDSDQSSERKPTV